MLTMIDTKSVKRVLVFGGSFDPPHIGHLQVATAVQSAFQFDRFLFTPCKLPVLKAPTEASAEARLAMLTLALQDHPEFTIDCREINRDTPSYMVDTLLSLRIEYGNTCSLTLLLGIDAFLQLPKWHKWQRLLDLCHLIVLERPGVDETQLPAALQSLLSKHLTQDKKALLTSPAGKLFFYQAGHYPISSTYLRDALSSNQDIDELLPHAVASYIKQNNLYRKRI